MRSYKVLQRFFSILILCFLFLVVSAQSFDLNKADLLFRQSQYEKAVDEYLKINKAKAHPNPHWVYFRIAHCYYELLQYNEAKKFIAKTLSIKDNHEAAKGLKGNSYWLLGRISSRENKKEESLQNYQQATEYLSDVRLYTTLAYMQIQVMQYEEALVTLNNALTLDGNHAYTYSNRALVQYRLQQYEAAMKDAGMAIVLDPRNPYAFKHRALIKIALGQITEACDDLHESDKLGYKTFGAETDASEVDELLQKYCQ